MQPLIILLAAPSGTGKSTMAKRLFEDFPNLIFSISATTRPPREGESHGVDYYFLNMDEFQQKIDDKDFLEWGILWWYSLRNIAFRTCKNTEKGYFTLLDVDVKGAVRIKSLFNERCLALLRPPSLEILEERLRNRNTESESSLKLRIDRAEEELRYASHFDNIITNDDLEKAYSELKDVVQTFMNSY